MWIGNSEILVNGQTKTMDVVPEIINGRTMVPIRFAVENLGCIVDWIADTREIIIEY